MLTPKQQALFNKLADVLKPLGAEVDKPSIEYRTNVAISNRVSDWVAALQSSPARKRTVLREVDTTSEGEIVQPRGCNAAVRSRRSPFDLDPADLHLLESQHGPKSTWKYPLNWTPW